MAVPLNTDEPDILTDPENTDEPNTYNDPELIPDPVEINASLYPKSITDGASFDIVKLPPLNILALLEFPGANPMAELEDIFVLLPPNATLPLLLPILASLVVN